MKQQAASNSANSSTPLGLKLFRWALGLLGVAGIAIGILGLPSQLGPTELLGLLTWLAVAVLLHDGVLVPLSQLVGAGLRRLSFGLRPVSAAVIRVALFIGAILTLLVLPLLKAQQVAKQESVLQGDYLIALLLFWLGLAIAAAGVVMITERRARARGGRQV